MMREPLVEAAGHLGAVIDRARRGESTMLTDDDHDTAVVIPAGDYARYQEWALEQDIRAQVATLDDDHCAGSIMLPAPQDVRAFFEGLGAAS